MPGQKRFDFASERPILSAFLGIRFTCSRSRPFSAGERPSYYAAAGVLSRSSGILFTVKPNGDWLAVRYNDTEKQHGALGVPQWNLQAGPNSGTDPNPLCSIEMRGTS